MRLVLILLGVSAIFELLLYALPREALRRLMAAILIILSFGTACWLLVDLPSLWMLMVLVLGGYRVVNLLRIVLPHIAEPRLRRVTFRASLWLISFQLLTLLLWRATLAWLVLPSTWWLAVCIAQLAMAAVFFASTVRHLITTRLPNLTKSVLSTAELPSLTVAIPARNETDDLDACLAALVTSDYPKLEILVLDDCSQTKRTPEIIRSYAHAGVRFLQGEVPPDDWLAKNFAYEQLYKAASGELILFCGVDVRFAPQSLRLLVTALQVKHKQMISILPRNKVPGWTLPRAITMVQGMRYAWELALPRRFFERPPVLSTLWLIERRSVEAAGGFAAVSNSIMPESYFAKQTLAGDGYSFLRSSDEMGIVSNKSLHEQHSTAVRVQYPRLRRRLELVALLSFIQLVGIVGAYVALIWAIIGLAPSSVLIPSALSVLLLTITWTMVQAAAYRRLLVRSLVTLPLAALLDLLLLHESMIAYEFFEVVWKERNVCIPVMQQSRPGVPEPQPIQPQLSA